MHFLVYTHTEVMEDMYSGGLRTTLAGSTMNEQVKIIKAKCMQSLVEGCASDVLLIGAAILEAVNVEIIQRMLFYELTPRDTCIYVASIFYYAESS